MGEVVDDDAVTWALIAGDAREFGVSERGAELHAWALAVHERFFGAEWLRAAAARRDVPFLNASLWAAPRVDRLVCFVERACQLALAETDWPRLRTQRQDDRPSEQVTHLRLVLEVAGWARRAGLHVAIEPQLDTGRKPDLLLAAPGGPQALVEVTAQNVDRDIRQAEGYGAVVEAHWWPLQRDHGVVVTVISEEVLSEVEVDAWFRRAIEAVGQVLATQVPRQVRWRGNTLTVHPPGTPVDVVHDGPPVSGDAWERIGRRLVDKAKQTRGGPAAWIRLELHPLSLSVTPFAQWSPPEQLQALASNTAAALAEHPHVAGVLISFPPARSGLEDATIDLDGCDVAPGTPPSSGDAVMLTRRLPAGRSRTTFVLPHPAARARDTVGAVDPAQLLGQEGSWLGWALSELGRGSLADLGVQDSPPSPAHR